MATLSLSDAAPKVDGDIGFALANVNFSLGSGGTYDTEDPAVISAATVHPFLKVEQPAPVEQEVEATDENDPHQNPAADHLSVYATPEVKAAADEADAAIQEAAFPDNPNAAAADLASEPTPAKDASPAPQAPVAPAPSKTAPTTSGASA